MRFLLFVFAISSFCFEAFSQKELDFTIYDTIICKDITNNYDIKAKVYDFKDEISQFYIDSSSNTSTILLRDLNKNEKKKTSKGNILLFDFEKNHILWNKTYDFNSESVFQIDSLLLFFSNDSTELLDIHSGKAKWKLPRSFHYIISQKKIGFAYENNDNPKSVEAICLKTGDTLWKKELNKDIAWQELQKVNDSIYIINANGFYALNINNGSELNIKEKTDDKDYTGVVVKTAFGMVLSIILDSYELESYEPSVVDNICSNVLFDSSCFFFASIKSLSKIVNDTITLWKVDLSKKEISHSNLFKRDSVLYMVNYGYAMKEGRKIAYGKPFLRAYNESTGDLIYSVMLEGESVLEYKIRKDRIVFLFDNGISQYSLIDGVFISNRKFDTKKYGNIISFIGDNVYCKQGYTYQPLVKKDKNNYCIYFSTGYLKLLNSRFETIDEKSYEDFSFLDVEYNGFKLLSNDTLRVLINSNGVPILNLPNFFNASFSRGKIYGSNENRLLEIDFMQFGLKP